MKKCRVVKQYCTRDEYCIICNGLHVDSIILHAARIVKYQVIGKLVFIVIISLFSYVMLEVSYVILGKSA